MSKTVKIQVPIDKDTRDRLEKRAGALGFDSIQAYIRVWAKAEVDGRELDFGEDGWGQPSAKTLARLDKIAQEAEADDRAGKLKSYRTVDEFMKDLV